MKNTSVQRLQVVQKQKCYVDWTTRKTKVQEHVYGNNPTHAKLRIHQEFYKPRELKYQLGKITRYLQV
jgi:hypothetical protein